MFGWFGRSQPTNKVLESKLANLETPIEYILDEEGVNSHVAMNHEAPA